MKKGDVVRYTRDFLMRLPLGPEDIETLRERIGDVVDVGPLPNSGLLAVRVTWREMTLAHASANIVNATALEVVTDADDESAAWPAKVTGPGIERL